MKITDPETIMYDRAQSKGYMEFGPSFEVRHKCPSGHEFTFTMHEFWYETNPKNKMYDYLVIDRVCPECRSPEITLTEDVLDARNRLRLERRAELEAERVKAAEKKGEKPEPLPELEPEEEKHKPKRKRDVVEPGGLPKKVSNKKGGKR